MWLYEWKVKKKKKHEHTFERKSTHESGGQGQVIQWMCEREENMHDNESGECKIYKHYKGEIKRIGAWIFLHCSLETNTKEEHYSV